MNNKQLSRVDHIILYLFLNGGFARRCDVMKFVEKAQNKRLSPLYFKRYVEQSPYYTFDNDHSTIGNRSRAFRYGNCATKSVWKVTPAGRLRILSHLLPSGKVCKFLENLV